ncbi:MAG: hypothetical protein Q8L64_06680 [bacterium]|nr:hypothetical protein [bacterium]
MNRFTLSIYIAIASLVLPLAVSASNDTGNPTGEVDLSSTCQLVTGWSYDADFNPVNKPGCTNMTATNYDKQATADNGSCTFTQEPCVSRYRWVNITAGTVNQAQGCAAVGAVPMLQNIPERGFCASGESRPKSGFDVIKINYSRGIWGGGGGGGGTDMPYQNGGYRCYVPGQKWDRDNTDVTVAYYCDFGESFPSSCPADNPPPRTFTGTGGGDHVYNDARVDLNFEPRSFFDSIARLIRPFHVLAASSDSNSVEIYDGPRDTDGTLIATVPANIYREDVNMTMNITGNHGFSWSVPGAYSNGMPKKFYFYGTDLDMAGKTSELKNSPMTFICAGSDTSSPDTPILICPASAAPGESVNINFSSTDSDGDDVRYLIDWDGNSSVDQYVPSTGYVSGSEEQSASRTWSSTGNKVVRVSAQDTQGNTSSTASCTISVSSGEPGGCEGDCGSGTSGPTGGDTQVSGFTINGTSKIAVQFLANLSAKTQEANLSVNPVGYTAPVTLSVGSIISASGTSIPGDVEVTYYFGGSPSESMVMTYDAGSGHYRDQNNQIGTKFAIEFSKKITQKYRVTIIGTSGQNQSQFTIEVEPSGVTPDFREI